MECTSLEKNEMSVEGSAGMIASIGSIMGVSLRDILRSPKSQDRLLAQSMRVRTILSNLAEPRDKLVGTWDIKSWPPPEQSLSVKGRRVSGSLSVLYRHRRMRQWECVLVQSCCKSPYDGTEQSGGEADFTALFRVVLIDSGAEVFTGSCQMVEKEYTVSTIRRPFVQKNLHKYRGEFGGLTVASEPRELQGHYETVPSSGRVDIVFHNRRKWSEIH